MVNIAIAGGTGHVAREVLDALLATGKHNITILTRKEPPNQPTLHEVTWRVVDYDSHEDLVDTLRGIHTVLSFIQLLGDPEATVQKRLVDAAVAAGVKRFAPSEYGSAGTAHMPWWAGKQSTRQYLREINEHGKVLEYTLFQPGLFLDYLAYPYKTAKYIDPLQSVFDFQNCRAILVEGHEDAIMTLTSARDVTAAVARVMESDGAWPEVLGIKGNKMTYGEIIRMGERIRGRKWTVDKVNLEDLEAGELKTSWALEKRHHAVSDNTNFAKIVSIGILRSSVEGAWNVSNEMNQLFPDRRFDDAEEFLKNVWGDKP